MPRGIKLTPERHESIIANARQGFTEAMCADLANITRMSINNWTRWGEEKPNEPYASFAKDYIAAKAAYAGDNIQIINKAAPENWQAAFRMLEFKQKKNFSDKLYYHEYPEELANMDYTEQCREIVKMVSRKEISMQEGNLYADMLSKMAKIEDVTKLREQLFEIEEKQR